MSNLTTTRPPEYYSALQALSPALADNLNWLYTLAEKDGLSDGALARLTGIHSATIGRVRRGVYGAGLESMAKRVGQYRENQQAIDATAIPDFLELSCATKLRRAIERARVLKLAQVVWGPKGIGKTTALKQIALEDRTNILYHRIPSTCSFHMHLRHLARSLRCEEKATIETRAGIIRRLAGGNRILLVDELHELFLTSSAAAAIQFAEFLREIYDQSESALLLVGTQVLHKKLLEGNLAEVLEQLIDRGNLPLKLPGKPTEKDVAMMLAHYGLPVPTAGPAASILADIIKASGIRRLTTHIRDGAALAVRKNETYEWAHFIAAYDLAMKGSR
jgi:DNA transposition AAA+ family ATPase